MKAKRIICMILVLLIGLPLLPGCGKKDPAGSDPSGSDRNGSVETAVKADISGYTQSFMEDIVRKVSSADLVRDRDYTVDDAKVETLIDTLDFAVGSPDVADLLGFDLSSLTDLIFGMVYTDDTVNMIVQMLYPMVETEFAKVWAGIPDVLEIPDVDTGIKVVSKANVTTEINVDDIEPALTAIDFYIFPSTLADRLPEKYAAVSEKLRTAQTKSKYDLEEQKLTTAWEDEALLNADGKLDLHWGVKDRDSFVDALTAALSGAEPLLLALLSNIPCEKHGDIGTGTGKARVLGNKLELDLTVNRIELIFTATPNEGYNNAVAPIFEALGAEAPDGNKFTSARAFVEEGVIAPVEALLENVMKAPVRFLLGALPNLAYAVEAGLVVPLLSMLKTDIDYTTNAYYTAQVAGDGMLADPYRAPELIKINLGEMIDLGEMGLDLSSLNGLLGFAGEKLGVTLPEIDGKKLATLGELTWHDTVRSDFTYSGGEPGKAAYIEANRADVLLFLLDYVFGALGDKEFRAALSEKLGSIIELPDIVYQVLDNVTAAPGDTIAAITELFIPQSYSAPSGVTFRQFTPGPGKAQSLYTAYWTEAKADYMLRNLPELIDAVLGLSDIEIAGIAADSLPELVDGVIGLICKAETLNKVAKKIADVIAGLSLPDAVFQLAKQLLGADLGYYATYKASFADGDRAAFKKGVLDLLAPVESVVNYLLLGKDISVSLRGAEEGESRALVTLKGNNGYSAAIIPLMEALGITNPPTAAELAARGLSPVGYLIDEIFGVADKLKEDPVSVLMELLPGLLFFIRSGCLTDAVDNLLYPVNVLLDVIRPVYNVNLTAMLGFDIRFKNTDPVTFVFGLVSKLLQEKLGVTVKFDFTTESLYSDLCCWTTETYTSANGSAARRVNKESINKNDMLTVIYDYLLREILFSENTPAYLAFAKEQFGLSDFIYNYLTGVAPAIKSADESYPGAGKALVFWVFFAADSLTGAMSGGNTSILGIAGALMGSGSAEARAFAASELTKDMRNEGFASILGSVLRPLFGQKK